jgi:hypothetical protein
MKNKAYIDDGIEGFYKKREEFDTVVKVKESISDQDQYQTYFLKNSVNENTQEIVNPTFNQNIENTEQILVTFKPNKINKTNESFQDDGYMTMAEIKEEREKYLQSKTSPEKSDYMNMDGCKTQKQPKYANCTIFRNNKSENTVTDKEIIVRNETASLSSKL